MNMTVELAPIMREDLPKLFQWRNDHRIWAWTRQNDLLNEVEHAEWFERQAKDPAIRMYKLVLKTDGTTNAVGVCGLTSIDYQNSRAEFSLYIAPAFQGKGIGKMALQVLLTHGFVNLGIRRIWGETFDGNPAAKIFETLGMVKEGTRRGFYWKDGKYVDAHLYSITREEFHARGTGTDVGPALSAGSPGPVAAGDLEPDPSDQPPPASPPPRPRRRVLNPVEALCNPDPEGPGAA
jgi:RimJ/RimL family protein N-acetyltransferase